MNTFFKLFFESDPIHVVSDEYENYMLSRRSKPYWLGFVCHTTYDISHVALTFRLATKANRLSMLINITFVLDELQYPDVIFDLILLNILTQSFSLKLIYISFINY